MMDWPDELALGCLAIFLALLSLQAKGIFRPVTLATIGLMLGVVGLVALHLEREIKEGLDGN